jgi:hypothetical protein
VSDGLYNIIYDVYAQRDENHKTDSKYVYFKCCHKITPPPPEKKLPESKQTFSNHNKKGAGEK